MAGTYSGNDGYSFMVDYSTRYKNGQYEFTDKDLFDRVINLKLTTGRSTKDDSGVIVAQDEFVIRSDFEIYNANYFKQVYSDKEVPNELYMRKCRQKPSIKVQYKQVAQGTAIQLDIFVTNFFVFTKEGKALMQFNNDTYPLNRVEVQMGYFGQFAQPYRNSGGVPSVKEFFEMKAPPTVQVIICTVEYVQTDKLPPDATLHIHGFVANSFGAPVSSITTKLAIWNPPILESPNSLYNLPHWFYNFVTRRFLRDNVITDNMSLEIDSGGYMESGEDDKAVKKGIKGASQLGVHVYTSRGVLENIPDIKVKDSKGKEMIVPFYWQATFSSNAVKTLNNIKSLVSADYKFKMLLNGDYLFYTRDEARSPEFMADTDWFIYSPKLGNANNTYSDPKGKGNLKKVRGIKKVSWAEIMAETGSAEENKVWVESGVEKSNILPAVYNITTDALCTIVCPYFFFINPFDTVKFKCRYSLGGLVSYYANFGASEDEFTILWQTISFATVEDVNECTMVATGRRSS